MEIRICALFLFVLLFFQIGIFGMYDIANAQLEIKVPDWIRQLAKFWSDGDISDTEFASAIEYLVKSKIITSNRITIIEENENTKSVEPEEIRIPEWIKNNAKWFSKEIIKDSDFVLGIEYMVEKQIIKSPQIQIIELTSEEPDTEDSETITIADLDEDGILDDVDVCPDQAETINEFEDSDGCPDEVSSLPDKSLSILDSDITWNNSGWGDSRITVSWTYTVDHVDESGVGFPENGHFVIEITGVPIPQTAEFDGGNTFSGSYDQVDPGIEGGIITIKIISFVGDDRGNYVGDGDQKEIIIPPFTSTNEQN